MIRYTHRGLPKKGVRWSRDDTDELWEHRDGQQEARRLTPSVDMSARLSGDDAVFAMIQHAPTLFGSEWPTAVERADIPSDFCLLAYDPVFVTAGEYDRPIPIRDLSTFRILCFSERPSNNYYDIGVIVQGHDKCLAYDMVRVGGLRHSADVVSPDQQRLVHAVSICDEQMFTAEPHRSQIIVSSWSTSHTLSTFPLSAIVYMMDGRAYVQSVDNDPRQVGTDTTVGRVGTLCHSADGTHLVIEDPSFEGHTAVVSTDRLGKGLSSTSTAVTRLTRSMIRDKVPAWNRTSTVDAPSPAAVGESDPQTQLPSTAGLKPSARWRVVAHTPVPDDVRMCLQDHHVVMMDAHGPVSQPAPSPPSVNPAALYVTASGARTFCTNQPWAVVASGGDDRKEITAHQTLLWLTESSITDVGRRQMFALAHECDGRAHPTRMNNGVILIHSSSSDTPCTFNCVPLVGDNTLVAAVTLDPFCAVALPCSTWRHPITSHRPTAGDDITGDLRTFLQLPDDVVLRPTAWSHQPTLRDLGVDATMVGLVGQLSMCASTRHAARWEDAALLLSLATHAVRDRWVTRVREGLRSHEQQLQENVRDTDVSQRATQLAEKVYYNIGNASLGDELRQVRSLLRADRQRARAAAQRIRSFLNIHFFTRLSDLNTGRAPTKERTAGGLEREERAAGHRSTYQSLRAQGADAMSDYMDGEDGEGSGLHWLYLPVDDERMWTFLKAAKSMDHGTMHTTGPFANHNTEPATNDTLTLDHVTSQSLLLIPSAQHHPFRPIEDTEPKGVLVPAVCHAETATTMMVLPVAAVGTAAGWAFNARSLGVEHERMAVLRSMLTDTLLGKGTGISTRHRSVAGDVGVDADTHEAAWGFIHLMLHTIRYLHTRMPATRVDADSTVAHLFRALWDTTLVAMGAGAECALTSLADLSRAGRPSSAQQLADHEWVMVDTLITCALRAGIPEENVHRRFTHLLSRRLHKALVQPIVLRIEHSRTSALAAKRETARKLESQRSTRCHRLLVATAMRRALAGQPVEGGALAALRQFETDGTPTQRGRRRFWELILDNADDDRLLKGCGMTRAEGVRWRALQALVRDLRDNTNRMKGDVRRSMECAVVSMGDAEAALWKCLTDKAWCRAVTRDQRNARVARASTPEVVKIANEVDTWVANNTRHPELLVPLRTWCWTEWATAEVMAPEAMVPVSVSAGESAASVADVTAVAQMPLPPDYLPNAIRPLMGGCTLGDPTDRSALMQQALAVSPVRLRRVLERMGWTADTLARGVLDAAVAAWKAPSGTMVGAWPCTEHTMVEHLCRSGEVRKL